MSTKITDFLVFFVMKIIKTILAISLVINSAGWVYALRPIASGNLTSPLKVSIVGTEKMTFSDADFYTLDQLKDIYLKVYQEDISFSLGEIHCLLAVLFGTTLFYGKQKLMPDEVISYMMDAYGEFNAHKLEKPNWFDFDFDLFNIWRSIAELSEPEYQNLFDWLKTRTYDSRKIKRVNYRYLDTRENFAGIHKKFRNMLDLERIFGKVLLERNYHPPISRVVPCCHLDLDHAAFNYESSRSFAEYIDRVIISSQYRVGTVFHRVRPHANFLNIILMGGPKETLANYAMPTGVTSSEFGTYMVARVFIDDIPVEGFFYICPSKKSERMSRDLINKAIEKEIVVGIKAEEMTGRIFTYKSFLAFFKALSVLTKVERPSTTRNLLRKALSMVFIGVNGDGPKGDTLEHENNRFFWYFLS